MSNKYEYLSKLYLPYVSCNADGQHLTMRWYKNAQNTWIGNKYAINMRICQNCTYHALVVMQMGNILLWDGTKTHKMLELVTNTR